MHHSKIGLAPTGLASKELNLARERLLAERQDIDSCPMAGCAVGPREDDIFRWTAVIDGPRHTVYEGGTFFIDLLFSQNYPFSPPKVTFLTRIYHCNINSEGKIRIKKLTSAWNSNMRVRDIVEEIIALLRTCNASEALVPSIGQQYCNDRQTFETIARSWTSQYAQ